MATARPYTAWAKEDLRKEGYLVDDVERKNCWSGTKNDLFGFGDLLAIKKSSPRQPARRLIVQVTGPNDHNRRKNKILGLPNRGKVEDPETAKRAKYALKCGFEIVVMSYRKLKGRWTVRVEAITLKDFVIN